MNLSKKLELENLSNNIRGGTLIPLFFIGGDNMERLIIEMIRRQNIMIEQLSEISKTLAKVHGLALEESQTEMELISEDELTRTCC